MRDVRQYNASDSLNPDLGVTAVLFFPFPFLSHTSNMLTSNMSAFRGPALQPDECVTYASFLSIVLYSPNGGVDAL